ncbi:type I secretion system permease/ATPase [Neorhizobium sp. Rsf11]|uniref:Type I secretion system permease/ATPase n=2 Tax=Neorhizobium TaxID=1525371 RepID=A0ABV0M237_9HYPH|nr:type I secretion system permease/ATPase [Neorhizobium petrolearium]MCC2612016.1 type I secretion system permease/ATPase [Neorhizobium petrolearium]WGI67177.1 type I secretion system permease/ATPase [Neorhizobium petrolearium]
MRGGERLAATFRRGLAGLFGFGFVVNLLLLIQPIYMLQVYDRVLPSASIETLIYISIIALGTLFLLGIVDSVRAIMASRLASRLEVAVGADALQASMAGPRASLGDVQPLRDLQTVRGFTSGRGLFAFLDLPFAPFFIALLYLIHPNLFWLTVMGVVALVAIAIANQWASDKAAGDAGTRQMNATLAAQAFVRNAESLKAMGMRPNIVHRWGSEEALSLAAQDRVNSTNALFAGLSRVLRLSLQIATLGYGGYLVLAGEMTAGMIFAASLISGRGLQPIDQVIGGWKGFIEARKAWKRLTEALAVVRPAETRTELPAPRGEVSFEAVIVFPPASEAAGRASAQAGEPLLKRISATIPAGACVAIIGPSGAGKTTLMRTLIGAIEPRSGAVRIDGADIRNWDPDHLGQYIGYLAQDVELLPGTIAQNIARFDPNASSEAIVRAAQKAQVDDLVLKLPKAYDTMIGPGGFQLSGGQRQRVGLARAFFGKPKILVLDEPNANLDIEGEKALERALAMAKAEAITVLIATQRRSVVETADRIMVMRDGSLEEYGPREEVLRRQAEKAQALRESQRRGAGNASQPVVLGQFASVTDVRR